MQKNKTITATFAGGHKQEFDVILTFKSENSGKNYVIYTNNKYGEDNKLMIFAAEYNPDTLEFISTPSTKEEWDEIETLLEKILIENR